MTILMILFMIMLLFLAVIYGLFDLVFRHPQKRRPDARLIPDSSLYRNYRDIMLQGVEDAEQTPHESVSIVCAEGYRLYGNLYVVRENAPLVIFFHGYHGVAAWDGYGFFKICKNHGINLLMVDERAHGNSGGNVITFGMKERYDCKLWTKYAVERFGEQSEIILAGVSMGAASVIMASKLNLPVQVKALVCDCGFSQPAAIVKETVRKMHLPVKPLYTLIYIGGRIFGRFDLEEADALEAVRTLRIPVLFIQGKNDSVVSVSMSDELYDHCAAFKQRALIEKADHANSAMTDYAAYEEAVLGFLSRVLR